MPPPSKSAPMLLLRVSNRSIFPLWGALVAGLVMLTGGAVLFVGSAGETPAEAFIRVLAGLALTLSAGARIATCHDELACNCMAFVRIACAAIPSRCP